MQWCLKQCEANRRSKGESVVDRVPLFLVATEVINRTQLTAAYMYLRSLSWNPWLPLSPPRMEDKQF